MKPEIREVNRNPEKAEGAAVSEPRNVPALSPLLVVISAPSGGGKTTLCQQLLEARPQMTRAVTCSTREPRKGEQDTIDY